MSYLQMARESLEVMRSQPEAPSDAPAVKAKKNSMTKTPDAGFAAMTLAEFATSGLILRVRSEVLDCTVIFAADNVTVSEVERFDLPVYRASELRKIAMLRPAPRALQTIHDAKTIFHGEISDAETE